MRPPNVQTNLIDKEKNITYEVFAYRKLTYNELIFAVRLYYTQKGAKPKKNAKIQIYTIIGMAR